MAKIPAFFKQDYMDEHLKVALGVYPGVVAVNQYGRNRVCNSGGEEEISSLSAVAVFPATALMTSMSQTTDQAALRGETVQIIGLDTNWDLVIQTADLNGSDTTTVVTLGTALKRVNSFKLESAAVPDQPIRLHNAGESQDYAVILVGDAEAHNAFYTVPNGWTAFMTNYWAQKNFGGGEPTILDILLYQVDNQGGFAKHVVHGAGLDPDGGIYMRHDFKPYKRFESRNDIILTAEATTNGADVSGGFDLIVVID